MTGVQHTSGSMLVIVLTGPPGCGKSTTLQALSDYLLTSGVDHGMIDMDHLRWCFPRLQDDPHNVHVGLRNLTFVAQTYRETGASVLLLADVVGMTDVHREYRIAIPDSTVVIVRLNVAIETMHRRLRHRELDHHHSWFLQRSAQLQRDYEEHAVGDLVIDCDNRTPEEIAVEIARKTMRVDPAG